MAWSSRDRVYRLVHIADGLDPHWGTMKSGAAYFSLEVGAMQVKTMFNSDPVLSVVKKGM